MTGGPRLRSGAGSTTLLAMRPDALHGIAAADAALCSSDALLLQSLHSRLTALGPSLADRLDAIVDLFDTLKMAEHELMRVARDHQAAPSLMRLQRSLSMFIVHFEAALGPNAARPLSLGQAQVQTVCQGLAVCVPFGVAPLFFPAHVKQDKACLQSLTETLLARAMALGLPEAVQANGEVLDILNWLSRALKAGLLRPSAILDLCFEKSLVLMQQWTGGDQCRRLLSDHNLGRCAVQLATIVNHTTLELHAAARERSAHASGDTNGGRLRRCILNLCATPVLDRLAAAPVDTVALLNVCNTVKDAIEKHLLADNDPALLPALDRLVRTIAGLPDHELVGGDANCRALSNFSNFLRALAERRVRREPVFQAALPALEPACCRLIACISGDSFAAAWPSGQSLVNLVSFVKLCGKLLARRPMIAITASDSLGGARSNAALLAPDGLRRAGLVLTDHLLAQGVAGYGSPQALGGLLAGLAYFWDHTLAPRSPALQQCAAALLAGVGRTRRDMWSDHSREVLLPALQALLQREMVTFSEARAALACLLPRSGSGTEERVMQALAREIRRLGAAAAPAELPPLAAAMPAAVWLAPCAPEAAGAARVIPGWTAIRQAPVSPPQTTASTHATTTTTTTYNNNNNMPVPASAAHGAPAFHAPQKVARRARTASDADPKPAMPVAARPPPPDKPPAPNGKKARKSPAAKMRRPRTPPGVAPPQTRYTRLCGAIRRGDADQVGALMAETAAWPHGAITGLLAELMRDLPWIDSGMLAALAAFFAGVLKAEPATGRAALTVYFAAHPPQFAGLQKLLERTRLLPDLKAFDTPRKLLNSIASSRDRAFWLPAMMTPGLLEPECVTDTGETLLHLAARHGHAELVELLLAVSPEQASAANRNGSNALMLAADRGHMAVLRLLAAMPTAAAQATALDEDGCNALILAVLSGNTDAAALLLALPTGAEQAGARGLGGVNVLMSAVIKGMTRVVGLLLASATAQAQVCASNDRGWNALMLAVVQGHAPLVRMLLATPWAAAQASATSRSGWNADFIARQNGNQEIIALLGRLPPDC